MSTHNLCFEQKFEKYQFFLSENFPFLEIKFFIYLNRRIFVMIRVFLGVCVCEIVAGIWDICFNAIPRSQNSLQT